MALMPRVSLVWRAFFETTVMRISGSIPMKESATDFKIASSPALPCPYAPHMTTPLRALRRRLSIASYISICLEQVLSVENSRFALA